jgi:D-amino-acid dehydrogenase
MHIIGGGIIGLCCAWYLRQAGYDVTVIERKDTEDGCSFGNSGIIVPSHSVPLASPGVISQGMKWMFSASSPFYIKPRMDPELLRWLWLFQRSCTKRHVEQATPAEQVVVHDVCKPRLIFL